MPASTGNPRRCGLRLGAILCAALVQAAACQPGSQQFHPPLKAPVQVGVIQCPAVVESSGLAASPRRGGMYWTINDSGGSATLYALDSSGKDLGQVRLKGCSNVDWEDIAFDEAGRLYVADTGDNRRRRPDVVIYVLDEPEPRGEAPVRGKVRFRFPPDVGPIDCEGMFVRKGWAYLVTKELIQARLYRVPVDKLGEGVLQAQPLGSLPEAVWITGADLSPDGRHVAMISYSAVYVYDLPEPIEDLVAARAAASVLAAGAAPSPSPASRAITVSPRKRLVSLRQSEAICWVRGQSCTDLLITNEQRDIYCVRPLAASRPAE